MAFIPLDNNTYLTANSYTDITYADDYFSLRNNTDWGLLTTEQKQSYLVLATDYIDTVYYDTFLGANKYEIQSLQFPKINYAGTDIDYDRVKKAVCELAFRAKDGDLNKDLSKTVISEKIDVLEVKYKDSSDEKTRYPLINNLLKPLLKNGVTDLNMKI